MFFKITVSYIDSSRRLCPRCRSQNLHDSRPRDSLRHRRKCGLWGCLLDNVAALTGGRGRPPLREIVGIFVGDDAHIVPQKKACRKASLFSFICLHIVLQVRPQRFRGKDEINPYLFGT